MSNQKLDLSKPFVADRSEIAADVISDLCNHIEHAQNIFKLAPIFHIGKFFSSLGMKLDIKKAVSISYQLREIKLWLADAQRSKDFSDTHELLCELNDLLEENKELLIRVFEPVAIDCNLRVDGTELFNATTYGGRI